MVHFFINTLVLYPLCCKIYISVFHHYQSKPRVDQPPATSQSIYCFMIEGGEFRQVRLQYYRITKSLSGKKQIQSLHRLNQSQQLSHHSPPHLCRTTLETLHYNIYNNINVVAAALSDIAVTVQGRMSSNTWQYLLYLLSTNCSGKHRQTDTAHCTAVLIKTGMFILITDVSLIAPQHQKVIQRQQLKLNLSLPFRRWQMLLISFSNPRSF